MSEDIQEIERLIKQSTEFGDSLIRLARKLQEQNRSKPQLNRQRAEDLGALHAKLTDLQSHIDLLRPEIVTQRYDHVYAKARHAVAEDAATPQEAVIHVLQAAVADKTMTAESAARQLTRLLRDDLPPSLKIAIREAAQVGFKAGDDIAGKIRPFLKNAPDQAEQQRRVNKRVFNNARGN